MSLPFIPDTSLQLPAENTFISSTDTNNLSEWTKSGLNLYNTSLGNVAIGTTSTISHKLNINGSLNSTSLYQSGTLIDFSSFATTTELTNGLATKQNTLTAATSLVGIGSDITSLDYNKITINKPSYFPPDTTTLYIKTEIDGLITNTSNYTTNVSNALKTNIDTKENILTFNSPLTRNTNAIGIDLSSYYNKTNTDTLLNAKEAVLTFNSPLTRNTNAIGIDLSSYYNKTNTDTLLNAKEAVLTFNSPLTRNTNAIGIDLSSYYNKTNTDTLLNAKEAVLTFNSPLTRNTNTIGIDLSSYSTTGNDTNYVLKSGSTMTGQLTGTTIRGTKVNCSDATGVNADCYARILNVIGTTAVMRIWRNDAVNNNSPAMEFMAGPTTTGISHTRYWDMYIGVLTNFFAIRDRQSGNLIRFIIDGNGNTAIGASTNASYKLTVSGAFNATSIYENGTSISSSYATNANLTTNYYTKSEVNGISTLNNFYNKNDSDGRYLKLSGGTLTSALYINNPGRDQTHFPYLDNGQNYIRGYVNIDQDGLYVGGAVSFNSTLSINGNMSGGNNVCKRVQFLFDTQYVFTSIGYRYVKFINLNSLISKFIGPLGNEQYVFRITIYSASGDYGDSTANVETMQYLIFLSQWGGGLKVRTYQICNESNGSFVAADSYSSIFYSGWNGTGGASQKNCIIENIAGY
jgi:hypothetical protein